jgi:hypothetical protein
MRDIAEPPCSRKLEETPNESAELEISNELIQEKDLIRRLYFHEDTRPPYAKKWPGCPDQFFVNREELAMDGEDGSAAGGTPCHPE